MPDQLFTYYIKKTLNEYIYKQWDLGGNGCLSRDRNLGNW
jgi:hypothetical protein